MVGISSKCRATLRGHAWGSYSTQSSHFETGAQETSSLPLRGNLSARLGPMGLTVRYALARHDEAPLVNQQSGERQQSGGSRGAGGQQHGREQASEQDGAGPELRAV